MPKTLQPTKQEVSIKIRPLEQDSAGFLPRYRNILGAKRALLDFKRAQPEDVDMIYDLLCEHITEPESQAEKMLELEKLSLEQLNDVFDALLGKNIVPPAKDAA